MKEFIYIEFEYSLVHLFMILKGSDAQMPTEPKKWAKPNVTPSTAKIIKQIALDENLFTYQVIDEVFRKAYPEYFRKCG